MLKKSVMLYESSLKIHCFSTAVFCSALKLDLYSPCLLDATMITSEIGFLISSPKLKYAEQTTLTAAQAQPCSVNLNTVTSAVQFPKHL